MSIKIKSTKVGKFLACILFSNKNHLSIKSLLRLPVKRRSHLGVFCEKATLKHFAIRTGKHLGWSL